MMYEWYENKPWLAHEKKMLGPLWKNVNRDEEPGQGQREGHGNSSPRQGHGNSFDTKGNLNTQQHPPNKLNKLNKGFDWAIFQNPSTVSLISPGWCLLFTIAFHSIITLRTLQFWCYREDFFVFRLESDRFQNMTNHGHFRGNGSAKCMVFTKGYENMEKCIYELLLMLRPNDAHGGFQKEGGIRQRQWKDGETGRYALFQGWIWMLGGNCLGLFLNMTSNSVFSSSSLGHLQDVVVQSFRSSFSSH